MVAGVYECDSHVALCALVSQVTTATGARCGWWRVVLGLLAPAGLPHAAWHCRARGRGGTHGAFTTSRLLLPTFFPALKPTSGWVKIRISEPMFVSNRNGGNGYIWGTKLQWETAEILERIEQIITIETLKKFSKDILDNTRALNILWIWQKYL